MRRNNSLTSLVAAMLTGTVHLATAQTPPPQTLSESLFQQINLRGPHAVGLKVINQFDFSRAYLPGIDELGKPIQGERSRPMQTLIWYPAQKPQGKFMTVGDYVQLIADEQAYEASARMETETSTKKDLASILAISTLAVKDAPVQAGHYPVIIYAPSFGAESWENAPLCEFIASHGYVVLASASEGTTMRTMEGGLTGANTQARDVAFLIAYAQTLPEADLSAIGVAAYSFGGFANLFSAARDSRIKAQVAIDGTFRYAPGLVKQAGDVHPEQMTIPLLFIGGSQRPDPEGDLKGAAGSDNVLYEWKHGPVIAARMLHMNHQKFASIEHPHSAGVDSREQQVLVGWEWIARYVLEFLDGNLKHEAAALAFLERTPEENGVPPATMSMSYRPAKGEAPSIEGFRAELGRRGFEHAGEIYTEMHSENPGFQLEESIELNTWVYWLIGQNHQKEALGLLKAYLLACPNSREVYYLFGQAYEKAGQHASAIESYERALKIEPNFAPAQQKLETLKRASTTEK